MSELNQIALYCCFIPAIILIVIAVIIVINFRRFLRSLPQITAPDIQELQSRYQQLSSRHPNDSRSRLVSRIINQHALNQGIVGALSSVGGIFALPIGLVADLSYAARSNASMSYFIAQVYGIQEQSKALNLSQLLSLNKQIISPDDLARYQEQFVGLAYRRIARAVLSKALAKVIPGAGAVIGFLVNWSSVQLFGRAADAYYSRNAPQLAEGSAPLLKDKSA